MNREELDAQLKPAIEAQLNELANANHCGAGSVVKRIGRAELRARIASVDRLACEVELISITDPRLNSLSTEQLQAIADRLAESLSYLEERLVVLEVDSLASDVQMRSETPRVEAEAKSYFEVHVGKLGITLQRFAKQPSTKRQQVPAALTRSVFTRTCIDLVAECSY